MPKLKNLLYMVAIIAIIVVSMLINYKLIASQMNNEVLQYFTIATHFAVLLFMLLVIAIHVTSTQKEANLHQPLWSGFVIFVVFAAIVYLLKGKGDALLFVNTGELICLTGLALLYTMRYNRKRKAEHLC